MFASGVDQGLIISWPRCPFLSASPYPHLHFTGYKAHKYSDTHTPGGMIQLSLQRSPPGQADLNHFTHISSCHFRYTHTLFSYFCILSVKICLSYSAYSAVNAKKKKPLVIILSKLCSSDAIFRQLTCRIFVAGAHAVIMDAGSNWWPFKSKWQPLGLKNKRDSTIN